MIERSFYFQHDEKNHLTINAGRIDLLSMNASSDKTATGKEPRNRVALRLIQTAADAFVTWEQCAGRSKAEACMAGVDRATEALAAMGGTMPDRETLRVIGRYNGDGEI